VHRPADKNSAGRQMAQLQRRTSVTTWQLFRAEFANGTVQADTENRRKSLRPRGFEPLACELEVRTSDSPTPEGSGTYAARQIVLADCLAFLVQTSPGLALWPIAEQTTLALVLGGDCIREFFGREQGIAVGKAHFRRIEVMLLEM